MFFSDFPKLNFTYLCKVANFRKNYEVQKGIQLSSWSHRMDILPDCSDAAGRWREKWIPCSAAEGRPVTSQLQLSPYLVTNQSSIQHAAVRAQVRARLGPDSFLTSWHSSVSSQRSGQRPLAGVRAARRTCSHKCMLTTTRLRHLCSKKEKLSLIDRFFLNLILF